MTSKQIYEATAIELSKVQAPALKLYEFNYFFNQAIRQFVNKVYNVYDVNQQTTDDLRVLKATATLKPEIAASTGNKAIDYLRGATYFVDMPDDYLHLLNCICLFDVNKRKDCWNDGDVMVVGATKLTADSWSSVVDDVYNRPTKKRPYYYIHNQNDIYIENGQPTKQNSKLPTNINNAKATVPSGNATDDLHNYSLSPIWISALQKARTVAEDPTKAKSDVCTAASISSLTTEMTAAITTVSGDSTITTGMDAFNALCGYQFYDPNKPGFDRTFNFDADGDGTIASNGSETFSTIEKPEGSRHANSSRVKVEIRCGRDKSNIFSLSAVQIDYVKAPQFIRLTQEQLDSDEDISQVMEFPDYVNQEIVNELVNLVMRKVNDPSLQAHIQMTQSIARPTGQSQTQPAAQA